MSLFIKLFNTTAEYNAYTADTENFILPNVSCAIDDLSTVHYNPIHDYSQDYLTTVALTDGTISFNIWKNMGTNMITSISYSTDNGETWETTNNVNNKEEHLTISVNVSEGDKILWKGDAQQLGCYDEDEEYGDYVGSFFSSDCEFNVQGNVMSMLYGDDFVGEETLEYDYIFALLFYDHDEEHECLVTSAEHMVLPATTLADGCYYNMFSSCTSLTTAPELPATTLANNCYQDMFGGCTSLTTAPELPATTLAYICYGGMFYGCTKLSSIKCLATNISASNCTTNWVNGVAASGTFTKAASMTSWTTGPDGIPNGWTVVDA